MVTIRASHLQETVPEWAILERRLIQSMNTAYQLVMEKYVQPNGYLLWPQDPDYTSTDALDDMYESFHSWPLFYFIGGDKKYLDLSHREFDAITDQFTHYSCGHGHPIAVKEYEQGYDWMHQGEGYLFFYLLNLADPTNEKNRERSQRYAGFLLNEDPDAVNYDEEHRHLKCCYLGSKGAAHRNFDGTPWIWQEWKQWYGLPFNDLEGIETIEDMRDAEKAKRMAEAMRERLAYGDTVINLLSTSMVMNAYLHTGADKYKRWILEYIQAWEDNTKENGGLVPDNVGPDGRIGSAINGKWYGGYYGWTWPHGFYFIADALTVAGENKALLTGDTGSIGWVRSQYERLDELAIERDGTRFVPYKHSDPGAVQEYNVSSFKFLTTEDKVTDNPDNVRLLEKDGWYEYSPLPVPQPPHMWFMSRAAADLDFIWKMRDLREHGWERILDFYSKYQGGQDLAWLNYLKGGFADYPEAILRHNLRQTYSRMKMMREDTEPAANYTDAYLQKRNPITVEGLVQLALGGPMPIYNGGLLQISVCYYDPAANRPGLPEEVAALVSGIDASGIMLTLCNLHMMEDRAVIIQAGAFGEHRFTQVTYDGQTAEVQDAHFRAELPAGSAITLRIGMERYCRQPKYQWPFAK